jgi:hypothetical protein
VRFFVRLAEKVEFVALPYSIARWPCILIALTGAAAVFSFKPSQPKPGLTTRSYLTREASSKTIGGPAVNGPKVRKADVHAERGE